MPVSFWIFMILGVIALLVLGFLWFIVPTTGSDGVPVRAKVFGTVFAVIILLIPLSFAMFTVVPTRNIGVTTTFGKPTGTLSNGLHLKAPWSKVTDLDGSIQIDTHTGDKATAVRLGNDSTAWVDNSIRWRILPDEADSLFLDYKTFQGIKDNLVIRELNASINEVFSKFDPLAAVQGGQRQDLQTLSNQVAESMRKKVGKRIEVLNVIIPIVRYDEKTQSRLDQYNQQVAQTRIAEEQQATNRAQAEANRILSDSVNRNPGVLTDKCLDIVEKTGKPLNCFPWSGNQSPVIPAG
ncbi:band-7-like membrane protein [Gordonia phage BlueNGold]|nr:band-7-like membrane protein [Gordonia phage BlueNGold]